MQQMSRKKRERGFWGCSLGFYIILMKEKEQGERSFIQTLAKFPTINIPYPIFDKLSETLEIPSSKSIATLLVKLITRSQVRYIEDVLREVKRVGRQDSFQSKMIMIYVLGLFALPVFLLRARHEHLQRQVTTRYALSLGDRPKQVQLCFQAYTSSTKTQQQVLSDIWSILTLEMSNHNIKRVQNNSQDTLLLKYEHNMYHEGVRLPSLLRVTADQMMLVYEYPWNVQGIQLTEYILLMGLNSRHGSADFQGFVANLADQMEKELKADNSKNRYYLMLGSEDIFISESECFIFTINRESLPSDQWSLTRPSKKFNYYHYKTGKVMTPNRRCDFWSLAIILLQIISMGSGVPHFRKDLKHCNTVEEVKNCAEEFIEVLQENKLFINGDILAMIRSYLDVQEAQEHHVIEQPQPNSKILHNLSLQSDEDEQNPLMLVIEDNNEARLDYSSDH